MPGKSFSDSAFKCVYEPAYQPYGVWQGVWVADDKVEDSSQYQGRYSNYTVHFSSDITVIIFPFQSVT